MERNLEGALRFYNHQSPQVVIDEINRLRKEVDTFVRTTQIEFPQATNTNGVHKCTCLLKYAVKYLYGNPPWRNLCYVLHYLTEKYSLSLDSLVVCTYYQYSQGHGPDHTSENVGSIEGLNFPSDFPGFWMKGYDTEDLTPDQEEILAGLMSGCLVDGWKLWCSGGTLGMETPIR